MKFRVVIDMVIFWEEVGAPTDVTVVPVCRLATEMSPVAMTTAMVEVGGYGLSCDCDYGCCYCYDYSCIRGY